MIGRVADTITDWGRKDGYFADDEEADAFHDELVHLLVDQKAAFNSPVWFNVGYEEQPQCSACFILSVDDSMDSILELDPRGGPHLQGRLRLGHQPLAAALVAEQLCKGGYASGPVSFMRGADASAGTIKSGGKTRRAAKMVVLNVDHPDIEEFIWCKSNEEEKARALQAAGYDMSLDSTNWTSIQYQNANNSVRVTDEFMRAVEIDGELSTSRRAPPATSCRPSRSRPDAPDRRGGMELRRSRRAVRHDDQRLAHVPEHGRASTRRTRAASTCTSTTRRATSRRINLHEVRHERRRVRRRRLRARDRRHDHRAGDHRRLLVPDREDRQERARDAPARPRLRQPRRAADGARAALRLRRGSRLRRRAHRAA